jgi:hypothetical protein
LLVGQIKPPPDSTYQASAELGLSRFGPRTLDYWQTKKEWYSLGGEPIVLSVHYTWKGDRRVGRH